MGKSSVTRQRILTRGLALMSQVGLAGITIGVLAEQSGMSKSGLFAHFRSKDDVQIGLLDFMAEFSQEHVVRPALHEPEGLPRLRVLIRNWFGWTRRAGLPGGCPVAAGLFEYDDVDGPVRDKILVMENEWRGLLADLTRMCVERRHFQSDLDVDQFVWELCGIYLSHHAGHRFLRSADADRRAELAIDALIGRSELRARRRASSSPRPR